MNYHWQVLTQIAIQCCCTLTWGTSSPELFAIKIEWKTIVCLSLDGIGIINVIRSDIYLFSKISLDRRQIMLILHPVPTTMNISF